MNRTPLPIDQVLPSLLEAIERQGAVVLEAPPGAGKTTRVPVALLESGIDGDILVLEPRRVAARAAAARVSSELGEKLGGLVGYTVRFEDVRGPNTRVRFLTEGVFTEMASREGGFRGVGAVVLDEFHERHVETDVALALCLAARSRGELQRLVVMSATLDAAPLAEFCSAERIVSEGRSYDVAITHAAPPSDAKLEDSVFFALKRLLASETTGDILVFLPGAAEIRRCLQRSAALLAELDVVGLPLHGDLPPEAQDAALRRQDKRKVVFSTNLAESSVTIDGLGAVIDSGLRREVHYAAWLGLSRVRTAPVSKASAIQRAGRAGRQAAGVCIRLYSEDDFNRRPEHDTPELLHADLADVRLKLAPAPVRTMAWLSAPDDKAWDLAEAQLRSLGAIDERGAVTDIGSTMRGLPLPPRLARMLTEGIRRNAAEDVALAASLLAAKDIRAARWHGDDDIAAGRSDLVDRMDAYRAVEMGGFRAGELRAAELDPGAVAAVRKALTTLRVRVPRSVWNAADDETLDACILHAYGDRVARRKSPNSKDVAVAGLGPASLGDNTAVRHQMWMIALDADRADTGRTTVRLAHGFDPLTLLDVFPDEIVEATRVSWNSSKSRVYASRITEFRGLAIDEIDVPVPGPEGARVLAQALVKEGLAKQMPKGVWDAWRARYDFCAKADPSIPAASDAYFAELLESQLDGYTRAEEVEQAGLLDLLRSAGVLSARRMNELAPASLQLANGRSVDIQYEGYGEPWVESYLQDFFGMTSLPTLSGVPVVCHLWAPNRRAVQVTRDLPSFWKNHYPAVRKELSRNYPRHVWPEDPSVPVKHPLKSRQ